MWLGAAYSLSRTRGSRGYRRLVKYGKPLTPVLFEDVGRRCIELCFLTALAFRLYVLDANNNGSISVDVNVSIGHCQRKFGISVEVIFPTLSYVIPSYIWCFVERMYGHYVRLMRPHFFHRANVLR